ncbi:lmo0937 family membrane protein [Tumidithrix elongata RA019]|uniref:Lmo0937 family membrane protein n=1 Tax=Tumidithrix elongata BACA0141 TaxID=2716417 RepID=A0AAW9PTK1_9CYAN|nr:lmo0937 family membrane protein [Tumidithrix elongata RA019]
MNNIIWTGIVVLFILWLLGYSINIGGGLIHLLLVLALMGLVYNLLIGRRVI